jgi:hypothetical protein
MIPLITKFTSNTVLYDAIGNDSFYYKSLYHNDGAYIYFLINDSGTTVEYNTVTEETKYIQVNKKPNTPVHSIIKYRDELYGFNGYQVTNFINETVLYIADNNKVIQESYDRLINICHLSSFSGIRDLIVDDNMNYYVIHNNNNISKFTKDRILVYTLSVIPYTNTVFNELSVLPTNKIDLLKLDFVREYTSNGLSSYPIVLGRIQNAEFGYRSGEMFLGKIDEFNKKISYANFIGLTGEYIPFGNSNRLNYNLTNYEYLKNKYSELNTLTFKVVLQNVYNNRDKITVEIPISTKDFQSEIHHFAFRMDGIEGSISVFCDGNEIKTVKIPKGKYIFQDILNDSICVGKTYFYNNETLDEHLKQNNYYYINNSSIKQFKIYNKALTNSEIDFHIYKGIGMQDLIVSLPCDQRNELDGIERQFKLDTTGNKSNKINILIKNSQVTNPNLQNDLKSLIEEKLKKVLPITTTINNIEFR